MGTDIHLFVEKRENSNAPWQLVRVLSKCTWCGGSGQSPEHMREREPKCYGCKGEGVEAGYSRRCYSLFAILADVRNGRGFAGIETGTGFVPLAQPRGLPADMSAELKALASDNEGSDEKLYETFKAAYGCGWLGDHSYSHISLHELLSYDWARKTRHIGCISVFGFVEWQQSGDKYPKSWSGGVSGGGVRNVSAKLGQALADCVALVEGKRDSYFEARHENDRVTLSDIARALWAAEGFDAAELERWAAGGKENISIYMPMSVEDSYASSAGSFYSDFIPALAALGGDPENTRIVFGFDS